jgi:DNA (cytosine-5)-methyltransferase 1
LEAAEPGVAIRSERKKRKLSQAKLSKLIGLQQYRVSAWETGKELATTQQVEAVAAALAKVDLDIRAGNVALFKKRYRPQDFLHDSLPSPYADPVQHKRTPRLGNPYSDYLLALGAAPVEQHLTAIALFSGCGGMSLGFKWAGFSVVGHVELDEFARRIYKVNFPTSVCLGTDIRDVADSDVKAWSARFGPVNVLFGGPPCQGFSLAGKRDSHDPRNQLYSEFARVADILRPEVVVLENVRLMTSMRTPHGRDLPSSIVDAFGAVGYKMAVKPLNAQFYGVPQFRERVFFLGLRSDFGPSEIRFPVRTHGLVDVGKQMSLMPSVSPLRTFRDATCDLEPLESGETSGKDALHFAVEHPAHVVQMLKIVPEGESAHNNADPHLRPSSGYNTTYKRLKWDEPCSTVGTNFGMISGCRNVHPQDTRSLTIREALRCQSFPDTFRFDRSTVTLGDIRRVIGNAVPPLLAYALANHVRNDFLRCPSAFSSDLAEASNF